MIDLHCHILPALDDGALDLADSVAMASEAQRDGITVVCATPHIRHDHDVRIEELPARVSALQVELDRNGVAVRIASGGELAQPAADGLSAEHLRAVSIEGRGWVLLEPSPGVLADELPEVVQRLFDRGAPVIVAHPERHAGPDLEQRLQRLVQLGCLIQWTAEFIATAREELVSRLVRGGLVHVLASDAHSSHGGRPLALSRGLERLRPLCTPPQLQWIAEHAPAAVLRGDPVIPRW